MSFLQEQNSTPVKETDPTLSTLVRLYENTIKDEMSNGRYMDVRSVPTNDIPVITSSATAPSADVDVATKLYSLCGRSAVISGAVEITLPYEIDSISSWISGFNKGLRCRWYSDTYRLSNQASSYTGDTGNGAQDNNLSPQMKISSNGVYSDIVLDGDVLFIVGTNSSRFCFWVNDRLITTTVTPVDTSMTADSSGQQYTPVNAGRQYIKVKFPTWDVRTIRIFHYGAGGIGDFYSRITQNIYPRHKKKINWLHLSDTFGIYTGALNQVQSAAHHMFNCFGTSINFINASVASTGLDTNVPGVNPNWLERWDTDLKLNQDIDIVTIFGSYADGGKTNVASNLKALVSNIKNEWNNCPVLISSTVTPTQLNNNSDLIAEKLLYDTAMEAGALFIQTQTSPEGRWLDGTGKEGSPAGNGNADIIVSSGGSAPSSKGHVYWGRRWARGMYDVMRKEIGA